jgi:hypothetical protein
VSQRDARAQRFACLAPLALSAALLAAADVRAEDAGARVAPTSPDIGALVSIEPVWNFGARRRADGAVQASTEDEALARWNLGGSADPRHPSNRSGFHVAPRIMVDTVVRSGRLPARSSAKGVLSQLGVLAQARNRGYWPFRVCYEGGLRRDPALRGKVELRFTIGTTGHVTASRLLGAAFKDPEVARCVATRAKGLGFSPPPARRADVDMTVELNPGDAPLPALAATEAPQTPAAAKPEPRLGGAQLRAVQSALSQRTEAFAACYTSGRARDAGLWGRIGLRITLEKGTVTRVVQHESRFPDAAVVACVTSTVQAQAFCDDAPGKLEVEGAIKLGSPPPPPPPAAPEPPASPVLPQSVVAETAPARLPVDN